MCDANGLLFQKPTYLSFNWLVCYLQLACALSGQSEDSHVCGRLCGPRHVSHSRLTDVSQVKCPMSGQTHLISMTTDCQPILYTLYMLWIYDWHYYATMPYNLSCEFRVWKVVATNQPQRRAPHISGPSYNTCTAAQASIAENDWALLWAEVSALQ